MENLLKLQRTAPSIASPPGAPPLAPAAGLGDGPAISFEDVRFGYGEGSELLKGVSFEVAPGQTLAIVGGSGSGKSSILRLLYRFFDPQVAGEPPQLHTNCTPTAH